MISSLGFKFKDFRASNKPSVTLDVVIQYLDPVNFASLFSNSFTSDPKIKLDFFITLFNE